MQALDFRFAQASVSPGWNVMAETLEQFLARRLRELDAEAARLNAMLANLQAERERVVQAASSIGVAEQQVSMEEDASIDTPLRNPKRMSEATIKTMVLNILSREPGGLTAVDILAEINRGVLLPYPRTSLSPQLSRLKADGKIHREGRTWMLGAGPDKAQV